jgi:START domain
MLGFAPPQNLSRRKQEPIVQLLGDNNIAAIPVVKKSQHQHHIAKECSVIARALGGGSFDGSTISGLFHFKTRSSTAATTSSLSSPGSSKAAQQFLRHSSSFLRVADLDLSEAPPPSEGTSPLDETLSDSEQTSITCGSSGLCAAANFRYAAVNPPPGVDHDPRERWVALDDGSGSHAPIAPMAVQALVKVGLSAALDKGMWTQHSSSRCFKAAPWHHYTWPHPGEVGTIPKQEIPYPGAKQEDTVLLWMGKFQHGLYGSELPAVRAVGIIPAAPKVLFDLLIDSERVKEYNKLSLGREDLIVLQNSLHREGPFGKSVTKVMRSKSRPPLIQAMQFVSVLHAQELDDKSGYLIVTRAVTHPDDRERPDSGVLRSEILLGVNIIRRIDGDSERCVIVNMIHMRSPMVPMIVANRIGASAAANFIHDLRAAFCC